MSYTLSEESTVNFITVTLSERPARNGRWFGPNMATNRFVEGKLINDPWRPSFTTDEPLEYGMDVYERRRRSAV